LIVTPSTFTSTLAPAPAAGIRTFVFRHFDLLVREADAALPDAQVISRVAHDPAAEIPVGLWGDHYCRAIWVDRATQAPEGHAFKGLRALWTRVTDDFLAVAGRALQLAEWARTHRFCGTCGDRMTLAPGERAMKCKCGHTAYPRVSPAMMVLVKKGPAILLARNAAVPAGGRMSALAGFVEPGESIEDAIHREVREEVGVEVRDFRYFGSQSWPFPHSLMIAFTAEYAGGEIRCDPAEIAEARWFGPGDELPEVPPPQSISRALVDANLPGAR
jgi:NAD+ diphosphatase